MLTLPSMWNRTDWNTIRNSERIGGCNDLSTDGVGVDRRVSYPLQRVPGGIVCFLAAFTDLRKAAGRRWAESGADRRKEKCAKRNTEEGGATLRAPFSFRYVFHLFLFFSTNFFSSTSSPRFSLELLSRTDGAKSGAGASEFCPFVRSFGHHRNIAIRFHAVSHLPFQNPLFSLNTESQCIDRCFRIVMDRMPMTWIVYSWSSIHSLNYFANYLYNSRPSSQIELVVFSENFPLANKFRTQQNVHRCGWS